MSEPDMVSHPSHYNQGSVECLDAIRSQLTAEEYRGFLRGTIVRYLWRLNHKGNPKQDARKAEFYLKRLTELLEGA